jgi:hypothetical protein
MPMSEPAAPRGGPCEICGNDAEYGLDWANPYRQCPRCGTFGYPLKVVTDGNTGMWPRVDSPDQVARMSGWVRDQNDAGVEYPLMTPDISRRVAQMRLPSLRERAARALLVIARKHPDVEGWWDVHAFAQDLELQGRSYSADFASALVLIRLLIDQGYLRSEGRAGGLSISGLLEAESLVVATPDSAQGFVAMSFDPSMRDAWINGFDPAIRAAGFQPLRLDNQDYVGGISDQIVAEIRRSRFVVADYTSQVNGVYFEAGFALGSGLTVIPTCRADEIDKLHFDIRHLNTLLWSNPAELVQTLSRRIRAVVGSGPLVP